MKARPATPKRSLGIHLGALALLVCGAIVSFGQSFTGLGDLPGGGIESYGLGISADGSVVAGYSDGSNGYEAFRWTAAVGLVGLGDLPGGSFYSRAFGVSGDGSTVVGRGWSDNSQYEAFRWTGAGMSGLGDLEGGAFVSEAYAASLNGPVVVGYGTTASGLRAFR